ncbi:putative OsmC-like protein [Amycolatopsis bartoniae]|uniref:Osmotically inducible protein C n=1 Tax=Amycolatopsis bartoniae TaxID=941986 RepID=A0A8H9J3P3_9PSEU|nr:OsmC family protein [Amycolatopsis bartoniae]MBB2936183.1 putative OsmC-like protein [Amycolatopsis bartoniae]TVT07107.1 OsmC family protein [Amycolatopsis bartoniae]GHF80980.1 osmotically inducible protein C [Amycolatopsis bartoniae]
MGLEVERVGEHEFVGRNERGAEVRLGRKGAEGAFSPAELLQVAAAGCSAVTAEELITRRVGEDSKFRVEASADRREGASELDAVHVKFDLDVSALAEADRKALALAVDRAIEKLCTVSRTLKKGIPVTEEFPTA